MKRLYGTYNPSESGAEESTTGMGFLIKPFYFVILLWFAFWLDQRFILDLYEWGIYPRQFGGLKGVLASPLIHGSLGHLANNTLPILALGAGLFYFYPKIAGRVILVSWIASGLTVWLIGRSSFHIGASGLIYALAGFIFFSGLFRKQPRLLALSLLVVFLYGGLFWGLLPVEDTVSWEAHLAGAVSGLALAFNYRQFGPRQKKYSWELEEEEEILYPEADHQLPVIKPEEEPAVWQQYSGEGGRIIYIYRPKSKTKHNPDD